MPIFKKHTTTQEEKTIIAKALNAFVIYTLEYTEKKGCATPAEAMVASSSGTPYYQKKINGIYDMIILLTVLTDEPRLYSSDALCMQLRQRRSPTGSSVAIVRKDTQILPSYDKAILLESLAIPEHLPHIKITSDLKEAIENFRVFLENTTTQTPNAIETFNTHKEKYPMLGKEFNPTNDLDNLMQEALTIVNKLELTEKIKSERVLEQQIRRYVQKHNSSSRCAIL